jgi:uncharacterized membrane protein
MDGFITVLVGVLALYLWRQLARLSERVTLNEKLRVELERDLEDLRRRVAATRPAGTSAVDPERTEPPGELTTPAPQRPPAVEPPVLDLRPAMSAVTSGAPPTGTLQAPEVGKLWSAAIPSDAGRARSASTAPRGPGLASRLLGRIGLEHAEGEPGISRAAIEVWLEGRMLAVVGGIALVLGAAFFLSLAFSRGWITEPLRVVIGLGGGATAIGIGELAFTRLKGVVGHVLVAVGLATISLALLAATRLFGLIPAEAGVAAALLAAVVAAFIAIRHNSQVVAAFGLVSVLAAPPLLGATPTPLTILFLAAALVGTTVIALFRTWVWLPPVAFLLAGPQVASSVEGQAVPAALVTIGGFWLLNTVAAGGEEIRRPSDRLRPTTVTLLLASAAFTLATGLAVLDGTYAVWRGSFVAALAIAHLALGLGLLGRYGDRHPFGLVVAATGVASISFAVPIQFGAPWVPVAWAAEGLALAWLAVRFRHPFAAGAAVLLGAISLGHLVSLEYPLGVVAGGFARTVPFVGPEGLTFAFLMAAVAAGCVVIPLGWVRVGLGVAAILTTAYVLPFELSGAALVVAWASLTVAAMAAWRFAVSRRLPRTFVEDGFSELRLPAWAKAIEDTVVALSLAMRPAFAGTVGIPISAAIGHLVVSDFPAETLGRQVISGVPYLSPQAFRRRQSWPA